MNPSNASKPTGYASKPTRRAVDSGIHSAPRGFWRQSILILLPVALLTGYGLFAVRRDYQLAEREAERQAQVLVQQLAGQLGRQVADELSKLDLAGAIRQGSMRIDADLGARWWAAQADVTPGDPLPLTALVSEMGEMLDPRNYRDPPLPPKWFRGSIEWPSGGVGETTNGAGAQPMQEGDRSTESRATDPVALRDFERLRRELDSLSPTGRLDAWIQFAAGTKGALTASGVPLANIALANAMREFDNLRTAGGMQGGLAERELGALDNELARQIGSEPSVLIPELLEAREAWPEFENSATRQTVASLRERWSKTERVRKLTKTYMRSAGLDADAPAPRWIQLNEQSWFAIPLGGGIAPIVANDDPPSTNASLVVRMIQFLPVALIDRVTTSVVQESLAGWPSYLGLVVRLDGKTVLSPLGTSLEPKGRPPADSGAVMTRSPVLASATSAFPTAGWGVRGQDGQGMHTVGDERERSPSRSSFEIEAVLISADRLYATARQRALVFGGLILAAAGTSGFGLMYAGRAFRRQRELAEMQCNFVSSVSHELRAPIASVRLLAEGLERGKVPDLERQAEYHRLIGQECRRLGSVIENVLDFARMDREGRGYEFEPTDLGALVRHTLAVMEPYAADRRVRLIGELPGEESGDGDNWRHAVVDDRAVQQALVNLIDNAIKHSPAGEAVTVRILPRLAEDRIMVEVQDHGAGIPASDQERIFEPFYRRGTELRRETTGIGIGLTIVKHVAEAHGGTVRVSSEPGAGSRFTLELPAQPPANRPR